MLLGLDPEKMPARHDRGDVTRAVREQNTTNPSADWAASRPAGHRAHAPVTTRAAGHDGGIRQQSSCGARPDGSLVRMTDIGKVRLGAVSYDAVGRLDGRPTAIVLVFGRPTANQLDTRDQVVERMGELAAGFPTGVRAEVPFDTTPFINASMEEVVKTRSRRCSGDAGCVPVLESWRATVIPMLAVPVEHHRHLLGLQALGFTVNT